MNKDLNQIGSVTINMFDLATGPYHHDFCIKPKGMKNQIRLKFNIFIHQLVKLLIESKEVECKLTDLPESIYSFNLKMIVTQFPYY